MYGKRILFPWWCPQYSPHMMWAVLKIKLVNHLFVFCPLWGPMFIFYSLIARQQHGPWYHYYIYWWTQSPQPQQNGSNEQREKRCWADGNSYMHVVCAWILNPRTYVTKEILPSWYYKMLIPYFNYFLYQALDTIKKSLPKKKDKAASAFSEDDAKRLEKEVRYFTCLLKKLLCAV